MPSYAYRAIHASGRIQKGHMEAVHENELASCLRQLNLELIDAKGQPATTLRFTLRPKDKAPMRQRIVFCSQMEDLLRVGLPFIEGLDIIASSMPNSLLQTKLVTIAQTVRAGSSLTAAFALHPSLFDPVFLAILEAGEKSGDMAETFGRLARQLRWQYKLRQDFSRAVRYPLFLLFVASGITSFMMGFVVPEIVSFLTDLGQELPFLTRLLIGSASFLGAVWWCPPLFLLAGGGALVVLRSLSSDIKERSDGWLLAVPGLGPLLRKLALTRFATSFMILLKSGLSVQTALTLGAGTLGNAFLKAQAMEAADHIGSGAALSRATSALFPPLVLQMMKVGEKSGQIPKVFEDIARHYERDAQDSLESFLGAIEPALTLLVGGLMVWIVLAVLGPVYGSLGSLAGGI